jgi:hypothetical protein
MARSSTTARSSRRGLDLASQPRIGKSTAFADQPQYVGGSEPGTLTAINFVKSGVSRNLDLSSIDCVSLIWIK